jgi:hypothetical protein
VIISMARPTSEFAIYHRLPQSSHSHSLTGQRFISFSSSNIKTIETQQHLVNVAHGYRNVIIFIEIF